MPDLDDFEFDKKPKDEGRETRAVPGDFETISGERGLETETGQAGFDTGPVGGDGRFRWWWLIVVLLLIGAGIVYWATRGEAPPEPPVTAPVAEEAPAEAPEPEPEEPLVLPALNASDELVRQLVRTLSSNPRLASWLATEDLIRRFTASVVNVSEGLVPKAHVGFLQPREPFTTRNVDGAPVPTAKSYQRYDTIADVVSSLDTEGTIELYRDLGPLIDEAFRELGYPSQDFDRVLLAALDHLSATPIIEPEVELTERVTAFEFADPDLENLSSAQKQLLRTGPENVRKIQGKLRELRSEIVATSLQ